MDIKVISGQLARQAIVICKKLLTEGKKEGGNFRAGSVNGEHGQSLSVQLTGENAGKWKDFSTGEAGDLIDLWAKSKGIDTTAALIEIKDFLGLSDRKSIKVKKVPEFDVIYSDCKHYLNNVRKISDKTLNDFGITYQDDKIIFPFFQKGDKSFTKSLGLNRIEGKKNIFVTPGASPCLFGWNNVPVNEKKIIICEGEIDAISFAEFGLSALSIPFGSENHKWLDQDKDKLKQFKEIILCFDDDEAGKKGQRKLLPLLEGFPVKIMGLRFKDANECLQNGVTSEEILSRFNNAVLPTAEHIEDKKPNFTDAYKKFKIGTIADIPPMDWVITGRLIKGQMSLTVAQGGIGKSLLSMQEALAIASGRKCGIKDVKQRGGVLLYNAEEDANSMRRRIIGAQMIYNIPTKEIEENLYVITSDSPDLILATSNRGVSIVDDEKIKLLIEFIKENNIIHVIFDPLVSFHYLDENSNSAMGMLSTALRRIAREGNCSVNLVHHTRKLGSTESAGNIDSIRGASSLVNSARIAHAMCGMSKDEAEELCIVEEQRNRYVKLINAKNNLSINGATNWFTKSTVELGNGDSVGILEPFEISGNIEIFKGVRNAHIDKIIMEIKDAKCKSDPYTKRKILSRLGCAPYSLSLTKATTLVQHLIEEEFIKEEETLNRHRKKVLSFY